MNRRTRRIVGLLVVLALILAGGVFTLRQRGGGNRVVLDDQALAGATTTSPPSSSAASASTAALPTTAASTEASAARRTTLVTAKKRAPTEKTAAKPGVVAVRRPSVKKGASVWKVSGLTSALHGAGVSWFYDWAADPGGVTAPKGVEFVPMAWGAASTSAASLVTAKKNGTTLLGFNEPDMGGQANMSVDQALDLWPKLQATGMRLGSPAVAWGADQEGQWLDRFMTGAKRRGDRVDFITLHWYGSDFATAAAVQQLHDYVAATYARYHKPIWLTEYALINFSGAQKYPSASDQAAFVTASTAMLGKLPYLERYAWFAFPTSTDGTVGTGLYQPGKGLTPMGTAYRAAG